ncbi:hypothetical protein ACHHYP_15155 [Achlya hypogyna]|uniref:Uncharacterized protein n=1 Tax=Achlya hypogyna TaxID=1202772 RepID=A0A1V9YBG5_ACHHY|nr:hypothetical protein ACHHYP_15155 [Achlya hypogyna]
MMLTAPVAAASVAGVSYVCATSASLFELAMKLFALVCFVAGWLLRGGHRIHAATAPAPPVSVVETDDCIEFVKRQAPDTARDVTLEETLIEEKVVNGRMVRTCSKRMATIVCPPEENEKHIKMFLKNDSDVLDLVAAPPAEQATTPLSTGEETKGVEKAKVVEPPKCLEKTVPPLIAPSKELVGPALAWVAEKAWTTVTEGIVTIAFWSLCGVAWNTANNFNSDATFWTLFWKKLQEEFDTT